MGKRSNFERREADFYPNGLQNSSVELVRACSPDHVLIVLGS